MQIVTHSDNNIIR